LHHADILTLFLYIISFEALAQQKNSALKPSAMKSWSSNYNPLNTTTITQPLITNCCPDKFVLGAQNNESLPSEGTKSEECAG
jgi:hypothetical protein